MSQHFYLFNKRGNVLILDLYRSVFCSLWADLQVSPLGAEAAQQSKHVKCILAFAFTFHCSWYNFPLTRIFFPHINQLGALKGSWLHFRRRSSLEITLKHTGWTAADIPVFSRSTSSLWTAALCRSRTAAVWSSCVPVAQRKAAVCSR